MRLTLDLQFEIPIWRLFYDPLLINKIPYSFTYNNKIYTNGITIIQLGHYVNENLLRNNKKYLNNLTCPNPIICAPNNHILNLFKKYRPQYESILSGHNAFINENIYTINNEEKKYDLIINSSFTVLKRLELSENIKNKVYIGYKCSSLKEFNDCVPKDGYIPNFEDRYRHIDNWKWINNIDIIKLYNQSCIGGIFSKAEGSCFSSSEYLLCGLPVISTKCSGGREHWYNNNNSIICEPTKESVEEALLNAKKKLENKEFNPIDIRNNHIIEMNVQRNTLTVKVLEITKKITMNIPDFHNLYNSLMYYHSNNGMGGGFCDQEQFEKEKVALSII